MLSATPSPPAGRTLLCIDAWRTLSSDSWVLLAIQGYRIEFTTHPIQVVSPPVGVFSQSQSLAISAEIASLLQKGAISVTRTRPSFLSSLFLVAKKDGGYRPILNLRALNSFVVYHHFKMEGWHTVKSLLLPGDFMTRIDLKDAYLSIPIHPTQRNLLSFLWEGICYQWNVLPFGLASAPWVFTKIMKPVVAFFRTLGFRLVIYLDDILVMDQCPQGLREATVRITTTLSQLGFVINNEKSELTPSQNLQFLGFGINTLSMLIQLPLAKRLSLTSEIHHLLSQDRVSVRTLSKLIGQLSATIQAVFPAPLHYRSLQRLKREGLQGGSYESLVVLDQETREELAWWLSNIRSWKGRSILEDSVSLLITSDSSAQRWGAICNGTIIEGCWSLLERTRHINELELLAAFLALQSFAKLLDQGCVTLQMDNTAAIAAINRLGSPRSRHLTHIAQRLWTWCFQRGITVRATHLPGCLNSEADWASRTRLDLSSWKLMPSIFRKIDHLWGPLMLDLFADYTNKQLDQYFSWRPDPHSSGVDAFSQEWPPLLLYAFPPFCLVGKCLHKMTLGKAGLVLIAPVWPTQTWYPALLQAAVDWPRLLPDREDLLSDPSGLNHPMVLSGTLRLAAWRVSHDLQAQTNFQRKLPLLLQHPGGDQQGPPMLHAGRNGLAGVVNNRLICFTPL